MRLEGFREREHGVIDTLTLLAIVALALVTWSCLSNTPDVPTWALVASVAISWILALAALTRHPHWSASIRLLTGAWMLLSPYLLGFADIVPVRWVYLGTGVIVAMVSIPGVAAAVFCPRVQVAT